MPQETDGAQRGLVVAAGVLTATAFVMHGARRLLPILQRRLQRPKAQLAVGGVDLAPAQREQPITCRET